MTIGVEGGTLTLERQETDLLASFLRPCLPADLPRRKMERNKKFGKVF